MLLFKKVFSDTKVHLQMLGDNFRISSHEKNQSHTTCSIIKLKPPKIHNVLCVMVQEIGLHAKDYGMTAPRSLKTLNRYSDFSASF